MTIDWTKPLELMDGTPVAIKPFHAEEWLVESPDWDGDYWLERDDGLRIPGVRGGSYRNMCVHPCGCEEGTDIQIVRNRTPLAGDSKDAATIIRDLLDAPDDAAEYEAIKRAHAWLAENGA